MLRTRFTDLFGLDHPVMSAPMANHSGGTLAAAVSAAGGLGAFGGLNPGGAPWVTAQVEHIRSVTDRPFAIGFITPFLAFTGGQLDAALAARPAAIALSFADPAPWVSRIRDAGARLICQVQTLDDADAAIDAGADVLVVQGTEAGGHTGSMSLLPFLAAVVERHRETPVIAAGGIGSGRTLAAALLAGAEGAWLGTSFLATPEAVEIDDEHRRLIVGSDGGDTVWTRSYDIQSGMPWPAGIGERVRRDEFTDAWDEREPELRARREEITAPKPILYGQSAAFVTAVRPAAEVVRRISEDAERILRERPTSLLT